MATPPQLAISFADSHGVKMSSVPAKPLLFATERGKPDAQVIRTALRQWGFNTTNRVDEDMPDHIRRALVWVEMNTRPVSALSKPDQLRKVLDGLAVKL